MVKAIFSFKKHITGTIRRIAIWNAVLFLILFMAGNLFFIYTVHNILIENYDRRLIHEIDRLKVTFELKDNELKVLDYVELNETDFQENNEHPFFLQIKDLSGRDLLKSRNMTGLSIPFNQVKQIDKVYIENNEAPVADLRTAYSFLYDVNNKKAAILQISVKLDEYNNTFHSILLTNLLVLPFILLSILIISFFLAKKSIAPINKIISTAENISDKNLNTRIEFQADHGDEIGRLRDTLNSLLDRVQEYVARLTEFSDNASHQLMNPLTAVKSQVDFVLRKERSAAEYISVLQSINSINERMIKMIHLLLMFTENESGDEQKEVFDISEILKNELPLVIPDPRLKLYYEKNLFINSRKEYFIIILENLAANALKFSKEDVIIRAYSDNNKIKTIVEDRGIGIPAEEREKIFHKFYRSSSAEKLGIKGQGLGLALVKRLAEKTGSNLTFADNKPCGTVFILETDRIVME